MLRKKNRAGRINLPGFRIYYKAPAIKAVCNWHTHTHTQRIKRNIDQCNKIESPKMYSYTYKHPEINSCSYGHLIFDKGGKYI